MPSPTTALQLCVDALALTNAVGVDQTLTAQETTDALRKLNDLIEDWSTQALAVYGQANQTFNTVAAQATYTIGVGGDWNTTRPVRINTPAYTTLNDVTFPCVNISQGEYDLLSYKGQEQPFPNFFLYVNSFPMGIVALWPVPSEANPITFSIDRVLTGAATAATSLSFPPGYANAFVYNLGVMLGSIFGKKMTAYPEVVAEARRSLGNIKRANWQPSVARYDNAIVGSQYDGFGWWAS